MILFEAVKQSVTTRQAAEYYGIRVNRNGMCLCPFHEDKHPSMKVDKRFHCFACQADGDVIDFASRMVWTQRKRQSGWRQTLESTMTGRDGLLPVRSSQKFLKS